MLGGGATALKNSAFSDTQRDRKLPVPAPTFCKLQSSLSDMACLLS